MEHDYKFYQSLKEGNPVVINIGNRSERGRVLSVSPRILYVAGDSGWGSFQVKKYPQSYNSEIFLNPVEATGSTKGESDA